MLRKQSAQAFGTVSPAPIGLSEDVRKREVEALTQLLADTLTLRDLYKKHHWQVSGPTFYSLHLLYDKHFEEQQKLVDLLAERIQILGGVAVAMAHDVAEISQIERAPRDRESVPVQLARLLEAHEHILIEARGAATKAEECDDFGTVDLLTSELIPTGEMQVWFLGEHLVPQPLAVETGEGAQATEHIPYEPQQPNA